MKNPKAFIIDSPEIYRKTVEFQEYLFANGISWHNPFSNECVDDFSCCFEPDLQLNISEKERERLTQAINVLRNKLFS